MRDVNIYIYATYNMDHSQHLESKMIVCSFGGSQLTYNDNPDHHS